MPKEDLEFLVCSSFEDKDVFDNPYYLLVKKCLEIYGDEVTFDKHGTGNNHPLYCFGKEKDFISYVKYEAAGLKVNSQIYKNENLYKLMIRVNSNFSHRELKTFVHDFKKMFNQKAKKKFVD